MLAEIDYMECLKKGLIGGLGATPGTFCSHPFDVIKIRMQVQGDRAMPAMQAIYKSTNSPGAFYRGLLPAIEQRLVTRAPMFLFSELYTQVVHQHTGLSKTTSTFIGSCGSGFTTGFCAGVAEYRKKLLSQGVLSPQEARWGMLFKTARQHGTTPHVLRRLLAAGCCSATYDSFFFGTEAFLRRTHGVGPGISYGCAAVCGVTAAFAFDTVVARMMVIPPQTQCESWLQTLKQVFCADPRNGVIGIWRITKGYRGLSARAVEYFVNYSVTGLMSVYVIMAFEDVLRR
eukprot:TRINITY_DN25353_c0_g1_i1.p1 TRINITY_DN25353_c0_g1~~TRINITY_DN25353_c0_g1_i1.p1  ORF type:complete len:287 (-),score=8.56 TRINITY_DN25353_c0_g1_i1:322-1182(-)